MKHVTHLLTLICLICTRSVFGVEYCLDTPFGYANSVTGGGSGDITQVTSVNELKTALTADRNKVIIITNDITFTSLLKLKATNKTLLAMPGVKLISNQQDKSTSGILYFQDGSKNLIIRNITFEGPGAYDCDGSDLLCFDGVTNAWVDHCDFQDGCDGNFDSKGNTDNITVSWCRFRYLKNPKAGGSGGSDDHRFSNLIGSSSSDKPSDGTYNFTWAFCWWDNGCVERMTRCRNASFHFLNCYWNSSVANYYVGPENMDAYFEGCAFAGNAAQKKIFYQNYSGTNGAKFVNCTATQGVPANVTNRTVTTPSYAYTSLSAADAVTAISNASCGAGATLSVTTTGIISSSCDVNATSYTITFHANNGTTQTSKQSIQEGVMTTLNANTFTRTGYKFSGWATSATGSIAYADKAEITLNQNLDLYAVWAVVPTYTVTFDANGGSCSLTSVVYTEGEESIVLPAANKTGYIHRGWYSAADGGTLIGKAGASYTPTGNITLYAQYSVAPPTSLCIYFVNEEDAIAAGVTNTNRFKGVATGTTAIQGSIDINGTTYTAAHRTTNAAHTISFTIGEDTTATLYLLANSSGSGDRMFTIAHNGGNATEAGVSVSGNTALTPITIEGLQEGTYILTASGNWGYGMIALLLEASSATPGPIDPVEPDTPIQGISTFWNFSDADFNTLGTISADTTVRGLQLLATTNKTMSIDESKVDYDGLTFTHCLKLGGSGAAGYRQAVFSVTGNCAIEVYLISTGTTERTLNICSGNFNPNNVVGTLTAPDNSQGIAKGSYSYSGTATTIRLYSAGSGINIYGIRVTYPVATGIEEVPMDSNSPSLWQDIRYNLLGQQVDETYKGIIIFNGRKILQQ